jgi:hypothetical protein
MMCKQCERPMVFWAQFNEEPGDEPQLADQWKRLQAMGIELGALVTVYRCFDCDTATALFEYDEEE